MLCLILPANSSFLSRQKLRTNNFICLHPLQDNLQDKGRGLPPMIKTIASSAAEERPIYSVWKKKMLQTLLTVKCFNNVFFKFLFQLYILFYLMVQTYHGALHTLNHSESEIEFLSINRYSVRNYLLSCSGSSSVNFNFDYHWNLSKNIKSTTWKSKIITFLLGESYC